MVVGIRRKTANRNENKTKQNNPEEQNMNTNNMNQEKQNMETSSGITKRTIPSPYQYAKEFDQLRNMGFPSRQIVTVLDSSEGNIDVAVAMLLSQHAQEVPDTPEEKVVPPPALQRMFAAAVAAEKETQKEDSHEFTQVEAKIAGKKIRNVYTDVLDLLIDYPDGINSCQLKPYFQQKFGRKLLIPEGESLSSWMRSIPGVSIAPWVEGARTIFFYEGSEDRQQEVTTPKKQNVNKGTKTIPFPFRRPEDWKCSGCDNTNFEWRTSCCFCHEEKGSDEISTAITNNNNYAKKKNQPFVEKSHDMRLMSTFKTKKCTNPACMTSLARLGPACPYWHTDADRRRNPFAVSYAPIACEFVQTNGMKVRNSHTSCEDGEACGFTHNSFEALYHPSKYKKIPCRDRGPLDGPNLCPSKTCSFFHSLEESRNAKDIAMIQAVAKEMATPVDEIPALKVVNVSVSPSASSRSGSFNSKTSTPTPSPSPALAPTSTVAAAKTTAVSKSAKNIVADKENKGANIPVDLLCSLSKKLMDDPVLAADGETYERAVIERYIEQETASKRRLISPISKQPLPYPDLVPNQAIRGLILDWKTSNASGKK